MINSILESVKNHVGIGDVSYTAFDDVIITHINSVFFTLNQLGVGPKETFRIDGATECWADFFQEGDDISAVKTYMDLKVRMLFDPPANGTLSNAIDGQIKELEWRLNVHSDPGVNENE